MSSPTPAQEIKPHTFTHTGNEVLILRRVGKDRVSKNGFVYPTGIGSVVTCPDWDPAQKCGGGLHGWPWGFSIGEGSDFNANEDIWMIFGCAPADVVGELENGWKCKFRTGTLRFEGAFKDALDQLRDGFKACIRSMATQPTTEGGNSSTQAASGDYSTQAASGNSSKQAASGDYSTQAASGNSSKQAASGDSSKQAASGDYSTQAASGNSSKQAASGDSSKQAASGANAICEATGRNSVAAIANQNGRVKTGDNGCFALAYFIDDEHGWDFVTGKVGRDGVKANTWYIVKDGKLAEVVS